MTACTLNEWNTLSTDHINVMDMNLQNKLQSRLAITRIGYNAVGRGPQISAARGEMGATANNNAYFYEILMFVLYRCI